MNSDNPSDEESASPLQLREGTVPYEVLKFLARNDDRVFTVTEIHEATEIEHDSVGSALPRLENRGLVRQEGQSWRIGEDDRLASYASQMFSDSVAIADDYYAEE